MKTGRGGADKSLLSDRSGQSLAIQYVASLVAPHVATVRASYTVPAGKRFQLLGCGLAAVIDAVMATPGIAGARLRFTPTSGGLTPLTASWFGTATAVGAGGLISTSVQALLDAGNLLELVTEDAFASGSRRYDLGAYGYEYTP